MEIVPNDDKIQNEEELREVFAKLGVEYTEWNILLLDFILLGAKPNAALTLADCRRQLRGIRPAAIFPIIQGLEKDGILERVPGHKPVAWRTVEKKK